MSDFKPKYGDEILSVEGRFSFPKLDKPDTGHKFSRGNYNTTFLVSKDDMEGEEFKAMMQALCNVAGVDKIDDLEKHPFCNADGTPKDGDEGRYAGKDGYPGCVFMKIGTKQKPECFTSIDVDEPEVIDATNIKSGDYGRLILTPSCYDEGQTTFYLKAVMLTKVGDRLTSSGSTGSSTDAKAFFATAVSGGSKAPTTTKTTGTKKSSINDILG